jgi:hypothetical protein
MLSINTRTAMFCKEREYPLIALNTLPGFTEDKAAARRYRCRFLPWSLSCVTALLCFSACIAIPLWRKQYDPVPQIFMLLSGAFSAVCIVLFVATWRRMFRVIPVSARSGRPMEIYRLEDTIKDEKYELIYICRESRTYFRMVFRSPGG